MYKNLYPHLFQPLRLKGLMMKNRIMSAPNMLFHTVDGRPTQYYISYLEHKARGGAGLVTLGEIPVCDGASHTPPMRWTWDNLPLFGEMAAAIHEHGALAAVELVHGGMRANPKYNTVPIKGPVAGVNHLGAEVQAMTVEDMEQVADAFAEAAAFWYHAGFDAVLIHAAHGWLIPQFLSPLINKRTDEYGGSLENRMRFPLAILRRVREKVGDGKVIMLRLSGSERHPEGFTTDDIVAFLERAQQYVDLAEISTEGVTNFFAITYSPWGQNVELAAAIKAAGKIKIPIFTLGSIVSPEQAEDIIASGKADGVSMSRALLADPFLPKKAALGRADEIVPCLRCLNCTDSDNARRHLVCSVNPLIGREARLGFADTLGKANRRLKVLVAGGGPAGMQAAVTASERGHDVILCEKSDSLGGLLKLLARDSLKKDLRRFTEYLLRRVASSGVAVKLNTEVNRELVAAEAPDAVIVAVGSLPLLPKAIRGIEKAKHITSIYQQEPDNSVQKRVVIIGGGLAGVESGLHLANMGKKVTVLEMLPEYAIEAGGVYRLGLQAKAEELGLNIITGARCLEVADGSVRYEKDGRESEVECDAVYYATGMISNTQPYLELADTAPFVIPVGDCRRAGKIDGAIHSGYFAALDLGML
ncbi:MAG: FAD-dependent oxidoreductase [Firmicutes bacterium]|nr:FAD-dependent oxidoreductase [Bacillota bacterium]